MFGKALQMDFLQREFPEAMRAFNTVGLKTAIELNFNPRKLRKAIKEKELDTQKTHFGFLTHIERYFVEGSYYSSEQIRAILKKGIQEFKLYSLTPTLQLLRMYCLLSKRVTIGKTPDGREQKGYQILSVLHKQKD
jgi:hypothetical protein